MGSVLGSFLVGALLLLLGCYLTFGPLFADQTYEAQPGTNDGFALPSWFYFPVGVPVQVSWSQMNPPDFVNVTECSSVQGTHCVGPGVQVASGVGAQGSTTFTAAEGQTYGVYTSSEGAMSVQVQYTGVYGVVLFLAWVAGVVAIALGFIYNHQRGSRYAPIF